MAKLLNAPVKYFGGKGTMWGKISSFFPEKGTYTTYIEPFSGAYSVGLKACADVPNEIYNDLEPNVYSLYKTLTDEDLYNEFKLRCDLTFYSEDLRREYKKKLEEDKDLPLIDRAYMYFYLNRINRNGIGGMSINRMPRRGMAKCTSDFLSAIERLPELHERLKKVNVLNKDGIELIKEHDNDQTLIYCDPPYDWSTRTSTRYKVDMNGEMQNKFLDTVINSKSKILISGYDCERYKILEENGFEKINFNVVVYSGNNNESKEKTETLWKNY